MCCLRSCRQLQKGANLRDHPCYCTTLPSNNLLSLTINVRADAAISAWACLNVVNSDAVVFKLPAVMFEQEPKHVWNPSCASGSLQALHRHTQHALLLQGLLWCYSLQCSVIQNNGGHHVHVQGRRACGRTILELQTLGGPCRAKMAAIALQWHLSTCSPVGMPHSALMRGIPAVERQLVEQQ